MCCSSPGIQVELLYDVTYLFKAMNIWMMDCSSIGISTQQSSLIDTLFPTLTYQPLIVKVTFLNQHSHPSSSFKKEKKTSHSIYIYVHCMTYIDSCFSDDNEFSLFGLELTKLFSLLYPRSPPGSALACRSLFSFLSLYLYTPFWTLRSYWSSH